MTMSTTFVCRSKDKWSCRAEKGAKGEEWRYSERENGGAVIERGTTSAGTEREGER